MRANTRDPSAGRRLLLHLPSLLAWKPSTRPWHLPFLASRCVGIPALAGAWFGQFGSGVLASLGALAILDMPQTSVPHRMVTLAVASLGLAACFALGVATSFNPYVSAVVLGLITTLVTLITRFYALPPRGSFFFILVAAVAGTRPFDPRLIPAHVGLFVLGGIQACLLAFVYSLRVARKALPVAAPPPPARPLNALLPESVVIGGCVGGGVLHHPEILGYFQAREARHGQPSSPET